MEVRSASLRKMDSKNIIAAWKLHIMYNGKHRFQDLRPRFRVVLLLGQVMLLQERIDLYWLEDLREGLIRLWIERECRELHCSSGE